MEGSRMNRVRVVPIEGSLAPGYRPENMFTMLPSPGGVYGHHARRAALVISLIQIVTGAISSILGIVLMAIGREIGFQSSGLWSGVLMVVFGAYGYRTTKLSGRRSVVIGYLIINIFIAWIWSGMGVGFATVSLSISRTSSEEIICSFLIAIHTVQYVTAMVMMIFCCVTLCTCTCIEPQTQNPHVWFTYPQDWYVPAKYPAVPEMTSDFRVELEGTGPPPGYGRKDFSHLVSGRENPAPQTTGNTSSIASLY